MRSETQLQQDLEAMLETVQSPGFKFMLEEWTRLRAQTLDGAPYACVTNEQWQRARGELAVYDYVLSTGVQIEQALEVLSEADAGEDRPTNPLEY